MKITAIDVWALALPLTRPYSLSGGRLRFDRLDSTLVRLTTDEGLIGWGEGCPWGSTYLPAFARGIRAGIEELAPAVLGLDPRRTDVVYRAMNLALPGHPYVKSPIDMACWDIAAQSAGLPLCDLLGGRTDGLVRLHSSIPSGTSDELMAEIDLARTEGYTFHSAKVGGDVESDIDRMRFLDARMEPGEEVTFDVNRAWLPAEAVAALNATTELHRVVEQPCETLDQHLQVRRLVSQPMAIDESLQTMGDLLRIIETGACEVVGLKIGRVGGLTVARRMRDLCIEAGIRMNIEDTGGTTLQATAAVHLAQATPEPFRRATWLCVEHLSLDPVEGGARNDGTGHTGAPTELGLGAHPDIAALGDAVACHHE
ncbi:MAG: mandelate racemase/muconate lactonizing enzyme family protein [Acidimicrobiia bacterium]|nr:mandelate racemase/muconate lactonizing enzyme family protein [Acidimicrobiia bacterium]